MKKRGDEVAFGRTPKGQCLYDVLMSSMTGAAVHRKYPSLSSGFVLKMRRELTEAALQEQRTGSHE